MPWSPAPTRSIGSTPLPCWTSKRLVDALRDVGALLVDAEHDAARLGVEAELRAGVADLGDDLAHDADDVDVAVGADLAADDDQAGGGEASRTRSARTRGRRPATPAACSVDLGLDDRVEYGVRDGVAHLVRVTLGHRLGGEQVLAFRHSFLLLGDPCLAGRTRKRGNKKAPAWVRQGLRLACAHRRAELFPHLPGHFACRDVAPYVVFDAGCRGVYGLGPSTLCSRVTAAS